MEIELSEQVRVKENNDKSIIRYFSIASISISLVVLTLLGFIIFDFDLYGSATYIREMSLYGYILNGDSVLIKIIAVINTLALLLSIGFSIVNLFISNVKIFKGVKYLNSTSTHLIYSYFGIFAFDTFPPYWLALIVSFIFMLCQNLAPKLSKIGKEKSNQLRFYFYHLNLLVIIYFCAGLFNREWFYSAGCYVISMLFLYSFPFIILEIIFILVLIAILVLIIISIFNTNANISKCIRILNTYVLWNSANVLFCSLIGFRSSIYVITVLPIFIMLIATVILQYSFKNKIFSKDEASKY